MSESHPVRFPPPLGKHGVIEAPFMECGERVTLVGQWVECIRRAGHPVRINYGHSNGYSEWCFDSNPSKGTDDV